MTISNHGPDIESFIAKSVSKQTLIYLKTYLFFSTSIFENASHLLCMITKQVNGITEGQRSNTSKVMSHKCTALQMFHRNLQSDCNSSLIAARSTKNLLCPYSWVHIKNGRIILVQEAKCLPPVP